MSLRVIEYPKSEEAHKDHRVQLLAPQKTTQKSDHVSESVAQMLLEHWQWGCDHCPGQPVPGPKHHLMKNLFLISNLSLP